MIYDFWHDLYFVGTISSFDITICPVLPLVKVVKYRPLV